MPRDPKPWYRKDRDAWYVTINGRRHNLGPDRENAFTRFYGLMLAKEAEEPVDGPVSTFALFDQFLEWTKMQRAPRTYEWYRGILQDFASHLKVDVPAQKVKPIHLIQWMAKVPHWSPTTHANSMRSVQRAFRWAHRMGLIDTNPLQFVEKPTPRTRQEIVTPEDYPAILGKITNPDFRDLVIAAWETGARPQELRRIEVRHVDLENSRWVFPPAESKGKKRHRIIYLSPEALQLTRKLLNRFPSGLLFRTQHRTPWSIDSVGCNFTRLKSRIGRRLCLYVFRHSFATRMLVAGVDPMTVATLLGHSDTSMLGKVYQHLCQRPDHLLAQLNRVDSAEVSA